MVVSKIQSINDKSKFIRLERSVVDEISRFLFALGNKFVEIGNADAAFDCFKYSVDLNDKCSDAVYNLGCLYSSQKNYEGACRMFAESARMNGSDFLSLVSLAEVTRKLGKLDEAKKMFDHLLKIAPDDLLTLSGLAVLNFDMGNLKEADKWNELALQKKPDDVHSILNQALINMTFGNWVDWWHQYEFCLSYQKNNEKMRGLRISDAWQGQEMEGKTLLVISDQGHGDAIQFSRYLREAKELGKFKELKYLVQPDLKELMSRVDGVDEALGFGENMSTKFDAFTSLLGVMRILKISPSNCYRPPHIVTDPALDNVWKHRVDEEWDGNSKKVGIVWAGDPKHGNDGARSIHLSLIMSAYLGKKGLPPVEGVQLFSFQVPPGASQLKELPEQERDQIVDLGVDFRNFDDTASALRQMDLLISCDTSVPHLAGCLGINTWILVPNPPEWRWLTEESHSFWYDKVGLFRQEKPRDWDTIVQRTMNVLNFIVSNEKQERYAKNEGDA